MTDLIEFRGYSSTVASYISLARKWRPAQFSDVVGQNHITRTLSNAIELNRAHPGYLFTGSRGVGKTSVARIFAKLLRCQNLKKDAGAFESCDQCANCREITSGKGIDVIEIDGASNNGVDAVREIRENAKFLPSSGAKKVYIIDEVHMLTTAAFNALLKTLEEPPEHVVFIFATTEPHKIPSTILSRCQRFDFRRVTQKQIFERLQRVVAEEKIQSEDAALSLIAKAAEGSMRDALSLLDQAIAFSGENLTADATRESIGLIGNDSVFSIVDGVLGRNAAAALSLVEEVYSNGTDLRVLAKSVIETLHAIILLKVGAHSLALSEISAEEHEQLKALSTKRPLEELELIFQVFSFGVEAIAKSTQPKTMFDILVVKCACAEALVSVNSAEKKSPPPPTKNPEPVEEAPVPPTAATPIPTEVDFEKLVAFIRKHRPLIASLIEYASQFEIVGPKGEGVEIRIEFHPQEGFKKDQLDTPDGRRQLADLIEQFLGVPAWVEFEIKETEHESMAHMKTRLLEEKKNLAIQSVRESPVIQEARSLFGGELGPIQLTETEAENVSPS